MDQPSQTAKRREATTGARDQAHTEKNNSDPLSWLLRCRALCPCRERLDGGAVRFVAVFEEGGHRRAKEPSSSALRCTHQEGVWSLGLTIASAGR